MTEQEINSMLGTEFTYIFSDGDSIGAYIKAYKDGKLTCYSTETETRRDGWIDDDPTHRDPDGTFCLVGTTEMKGTIEVIQEIKDTGKVDCTGMLQGFFDGCQI